MVNNRVKIARSLIETLDTEAFLFTSLPNIRYLTGFTGSDGAFLITPETGCFLTDSRYTTQAASEVQGFPVSEYKGKLDGIVDWLKQEKISRVAIEPDNITVAVLNALQEKVPDVHFVLANTDLELLRIVKDASELDTIASTAQTASKAFYDMLSSIRAGVSEKDLALKLEILMRQGGADATSFDFILVSGERGALPHGKPTDKIIESGELVTFDFGAIVDGYCSDETVTVCFGKSDSRQQEVYSIVKDAHDLAIDAIKPGVSLKELDAIARGFIDKKGYGSYFGHGLGHGVGLEIHEKPVVSPKSEAVAQEGMVFTIEPGIYIPGWGGVRIEDMVAVTSDGCRVLTKVAKDMITV